MDSRPIEFTYYVPPDVTVATNGTISDYSDVYLFNDHVDRFEMSFTGWGMPPIEYITQRGPYQTGQTVLDFRVQPRVIQLTHRRNGNCRDDYWDIRSDFINALRPNRAVGGGFEPGRLRKVLSDGSIRDIYVALERGPVFQPRGDQWDEWSIMETIRFIAHDPILFNPVRKSATWTLSSQDNLVFPFSFPIIFGSAIINDTLDVTHAGTWLSYPTITITGPLSQPTIENQSTDEIIVFQYDIPAGSTVEFDLNYGVKTVLENGGTSRIGSVTPQSDLATFHIAPDPEVSGGVNALLVTGSNATAETSVGVTWYDRYIGI